ncbi:MAG: ABC transporter ATP-binding protein [Bacteroidales bacterium]
MINLQNISIGYGKRTLLNNISATMPSGELIALLGRNGTGKSTLLRAISGLHDISGGSITLNGQELSRMTPQQLAKTTAFVTTERVRIANLCCQDVVALGRAPYTNWIGRMQKQDSEIVHKSLELVRMPDYAKRNMNKMSDGECQRIMIARALAQDTPIILLDEPTAFLDLPNRYELCSLLKDLAHSENKCILFSSHELDIALTVCDSIALIDSPNLLHLPTNEIAQHGHIERLFSNSSVSFDTDTCSVKFNKNR